MKESSSSVLALLFVVFALLSLLLAGRAPETRTPGPVDARERVSEIALGFLLAAK